MAKYGLACEYVKQPLGRRDIAAVLIGICGSMVFIVLLFLFFVRIPENNSPANTDRLASAGQKFLLVHDLDFESPLYKTIREKSPEAFLYPDSIFPYPILVPEKQPAANIGFPKMEDNSQSFFVASGTTYDLTPAMPPMRPLLGASIMQTEETDAPQITYPLFAGNDGLVPEIPGLKLSDADAEILANSTLEGPTVLKINQGIGPDAQCTVYVEASCGNRKLDMEACRHLETFLNTADCPELFKKQDAVCRVVWAHTTFGNVADAGSARP